MKKKVVGCIDSTAREGESFISKEIVISTSTWWEQSCEQQKEGGNTDLVIIPYN